MHPDPGLLFNLFYDPLRYLRVPSDRRAVHPFGVISFGVICSFFEGKSRLRQFFQNVFAFHMDPFASLEYIKNCIIRQENLCKKLHKIFDGRSEL